MVAPLELTAYRSPGRSSTAWGSPGRPPGDGHHQHPLLPYPVQGRPGGGDLLLPLLRRVPSKSNASSLISATATASCSGFVGTIVPRFGVGFQRGKGGRGRFCPPAGGSFWTGAGWALRRGFPPGPGRGSRLSRESPDAKSRGGMPPPPFMMARSFPLARFGVVGRIVPVVGLFRCPSACPDLGRFFSCRAAQPGGFPFGGSCHRR